MSNLFRQIGNIFEGQYLKFSLVSSQTAARLKAHTQCTDLQNGHRFPSYYNLPESRIWWPRNLDFPLFNLRQHWCLLAEVMQHFADSLCVRDKLGQQFQIGLIPGDDGRFPHVEPGWTVTVMYPTKEPMGNLVVFRKASDFKVRPPPFSLHIYIQSVLMLTISGGTGHKCETGDSHTVGRQDKPPRPEADGWKSLLWLRQDCVIV